MSATQTMADRPVGLSFSRASDAVFALLIVVCAAGAFVALDAGGLWKDELFTAYFADTALTDPRAVLARTMEDVHPPLYYLLAWAVASALGADVADVIRPLSAVLCCLALAALYHALPRGTDRHARLFACALAATSFAYFQYAQEGRSYALMFVIVIAQCGVALRLLEDVRSNAGRPAPGPTLAFAALGIVAGLTHYYAVPLTGGLVGGLILVSRRWTERLVLAAVGLAILGAVVAYIAVHSDRMLVDKQATWFSADPGFLWSMTVRGVRNMVGGTLNAVAILLLLGVLGLALRRRRPDGPRRGTPRWSRFALLGFAAAFTVASSIAITILYAPSYSERVWVMLTPLAWITAGLAWQIVTERLPDGEETPLKAAVVVAMALCAGSVALRPAPDKETWLASSLYVAEQRACVGKTIPVVIREDIIGGDTARVFYGRQLPAGFDVDLRAVLASRVNADLAEGQLMNLTAQRLAGTDACPVIAWTAGAGRDALEALAARLAALSDGMGRTAVIRRFSHPPVDPTGFLVPHLGSGLAYVLVAEDAPIRDRGVRSPKRRPGRGG